MIETSRLTLREFWERDRKRVIELLMCPDFMVFSPTGPMTHSAASQRFTQLVACFASNGFGKIAVVEKSSDIVIGYCGIEQCELDGNTELELGYRIAKKYQGLGYATEAAKAVLAHEHDKGHKNIIAFTEPENIASINILNKLGFIPNGKAVFNEMLVLLFKFSM